VQPRRRVLVCLLLGTTAIGTFSSRLLPNASASSNGVISVRFIGGLPLGGTFSAAVRRFGPVQVAGASAKFDSFGCTLRYPRLGLRLWYVGSDGARKRHRGDLRALSRRSGQRRRLADASRASDRRLNAAPAADVSAGLRHTTCRAEMGYATGSDRVGHHDYLLRRRAAPRSLSDGRTRSRRRLSR
jgi:hypothetical protein